MVPWRQLGRGVLPLVLVVRAVAATPHVGLEVRVRPEAAAAARTVHLLPRALAVAVKLSSASTLPPPRQSFERAAA